MRRASRFVLLVGLTTLVETTLWAQPTLAALTGTVADDRAAIRNLFFVAVATLVASATLALFRERFRSALRMVAYLSLLAIEALLLRPLADRPLSLAAALVVTLPWIAFSARASGVLKKNDA